MQKIISLLTNEIFFWMAWVIIPLIMEIIPGLLGIFILIKKRLTGKEDEELKYYPDITLIIPVYNSADSLWACLESVEKSTYPNKNISLILVDNGSRDNSFEIFVEYQKSHLDMNAKWLNSKQGKSKALNMALFNSEGKYIIHIDSDGILHPDALMNMVRRFESNDNIHCMTGAVLTNPEMIKDTKNIFMSIVQKTEFYEYAQAFLAGRNYEAELNSIFTLSGAFSAFRKSTILKTQLYNTETVCEDTQVTFQIRYLLKKRIDICENAIFFVDPIESVNRLYVQRQRWQRGEIEVIHMFPDRKGGVTSIVSNFMARALVYDHTFAFPRMIWYFALLCLAFIGYPFRYIVISLILIYVMYVLSAFLYYIHVCIYLSWDKELKRFYAWRLGYILVLPLFNFMVYWFRFAGIINSIKGTSTWRTRGFDEEVKACGDIIAKDFLFVKQGINKLKAMIYESEEEKEQTK
ncbi:MAG: putative glycosyltransferase, exosortase G system-associated [Lachnospiraceae bacterium]|nr:putative glycosyltransferase, exosortase G system-associated [Lachnospiraceae bacterium]